MNEVIKNLYIGDETEIAEIQKYKSWTPVDARVIIYEGHLPEKNLDGCKMLASTIHTLRLLGKKVIVYCDCGIERSVLAVTYYMMILKGWDYDKAFDFVKSKRGCAEYRRDWIVSGGRYDEKNPFEVK